MLRHHHAFKFIAYVVRQYINDGCSQRAAALTYTSLFAVVPLITVMYSVLSLIPQFQHLGNDIEQFIFSHLMPSSGQSVQSYIHSFSQQARQLTTLGIIFIAITAWLMLRSIEDMFETIWTAASKRPGFNSFIMHWTILSLGPICLGLALLLATYLASLKYVSTVSDLFFATPIVLYLAPFALMVIGLTLLFALVPNCHVKIKHALIGAILTTAAFEGARSLFSWLVGFTSFELIYGTFAAIPLFLIWIYTSWLIILAGAEWVHALGYYPGDQASQAQP
ncbi:YihY family inner membrane protein [Dasania sp. GY-MA-18]|uniref:UPF0761 membrane protein O0V09_14295 n=1 Tax=Dasania phycosphaerae TaxID=2950436 RepID=A0A9J6RP99_9GAMM|nr:MULTISPECIES: YihY family inner membrane protein [Dasania]MCR8923945.1 YihY family inner membrane protein [Dasania sp. GY-MA-18]MCZ0866379.1 YihY family inner membrane protein [Dasania phycosphaerae]MCZ0870103.1 YihY family inner membrane protein [Dasania phycosphaerae]